MTMKSPGADLTGRKGGEPEEPYEPRPSPLAHGRRGQGLAFRAACRDVDPELFFPLGASDANLPQIDAAKRICRTCPVREPCPRWVLSTGDAGVWGGTTEPERRKHRGSRGLT